MLLRENFNNKVGSNVLSETVESTHQTTLAHCPQQSTMYQNQTNHTYKLQ